MIIKREQYLSLLRQLKDKNLIKVITGIRRCGKSTLLQMFADELRTCGVKPQNITFINFEERENLHLTDWAKLHDEITSKAQPDSMNYIFLDEVQMVDQFERLVGSLFVKKNIDLYITGSNAFLLSGELATLLTGRYISTNILPLSFIEYAQLFPEKSYDDLLRQYLNNSSLPEAAILLKDAPNLVNNYLRDIYETVLNKDIKNRHQIRDMANFNKVLRFTLDSIGSFVSAGRIADSLNQNKTTTGKPISNKTAVNYLRYLTDSFVLYKVDRYDIKGKNLLKTQDKYFVVDLGLRSALVSGSVEVDLGHKLENLVYLELRRRNRGDIWVGKVDDSEVDFMVQNPAGERKYYQVAWTAYSSEIIARELRPFSRVKDHYQKFLITADPDNTNYNGVRKINIIDWLTTEHA